MLAARIAAEVTGQAIDLAPNLQLVRLCVSDPDTLAVYQSAFKAHGLALAQPESVT